MIEKKQTLLEKELKAGSKLVIVNPSDSYWSIFLTIEVALRAQELGAEVIWINVARRQASKYEINKGDVPPRWRYRNLTAAAIKQLESCGIQTRNLNKFVKKDVDVPIVNSIEELRGLRFNDINLGAMIFSSVSSALKSTSFEISNVGRFVQDYLESAFDIYQYLQDATTEIKPDLVVSINDRILGSALSLAIAEQNGIRHAVVYWGSQINSIELYENSLYDSDEWQAKVQQYWLDFPPTESDLAEIRHTIDTLASGPSKDSQKFTSGQKMGYVPELNNKTIVFYAQSEYEHSAYFIPNVSNRFTNQYAAFSCLQEVAKRYGYRLILKYHPYPKGVKTKKRNNGEHLDWKNVRIDDDVIQLDENSEVDSYELIMKYALYVVWSSSVGLESLSRCRPTLVLGNTPWLNMKWGIHGWNREAIDDFLAKSFPSLDKEILLQWYWYLQSFGSPTKYAHLHGYNITVNGKLMTRDRIIFSANRLVKRLLVRIAGSR